MEISISALPYQTLKKTFPDICFSIPQYFSPIPFEKVKSIILLYDKEQLEEIKALNSFFSLKINIQIGSTPEQMHELLTLSPPMATLSNLQRKDNCLDLLLFKEQIQELLQNFSFPRENLTIRIEADPEQIKVVSKLGFSKAEIDFPYPFSNEKEYLKFDETIKISQKIGVSISFGKGLKLEQISEILKKHKPDELIIDFPFYQIALKEGIEKSLNSIKQIISSFNTK